MIIENFNEALELAAGAGDNRISSISINNPATVSPERMLRVREIIRRFCEHLPYETTVIDILDAFDE
jgi:hypothetical protein